MVVVAQAAPLVIEHPLERGHALHHRCDLIDLLLVFDGGEAHAGMVEHEREFVGDGIGVDRYRNGAEHLRGGHRPIELRAVGTDDGDGIAALQTKPVQAGGIGAHDLEHFAPGPALPDAQILVPHGRPRAIQARVMSQKLRECLRTCGA